MSPQQLFPEETIVESQMDRIENKLNRILEIIDKPKVTRSAPKNEYTDQFEKLWSIYPSRSGSNPKIKAFQAFNARLSEMCDPRDIEQGLRRYAAYCDAMNKTGTELTMQAARFFGPNHEWEADWSIPESATVVRIPRGEDELVAFGRSIGVDTSPGESWAEYRQRVERAAS